MRRSSLIGLIAVALIAGVIAAVAGSGDGRGYRVRAIFDDAFALIPGEDVKIAGVKVGTVESLDVTEGKKAAVVLEIYRDGFKDFRANAHCTIRPQSLIGEKYVDCVPTEPRMSGEPIAPSLKRIPDGEQGAGEYLLPVTNTSSPVDLDLIASTLRLPYRQRLAIVINELGTGLAGRGKELREVIRRADPALAQTDRVLAILAAQNRSLAQLATDSDAVIASLALNRQHVAGFIDSAGVTAAAVAAQRTDLARTFRRLPSFLRELGPTMTDLGELAAQGTPVLDDIGAVAPQLSQLAVDLGPFAKAGGPAIETLGDAAALGTPAVKAAESVVSQLKTLAADTGGVAANLAKLGDSLKSTGGIKRLMQLLYYTVGATNGYDSLGHFQRVMLLASLCITYATTPTVGCSANFVKQEENDSAKSAKTSRAKRPTIASVVKSARALDREDSVGSTAPKRRSRKSRRFDEVPDSAVLDYLLGDGSR